ncbi:glycosyltransferase family 4 protein [Enterococcus innesii]|uniref:glycosyltransferase family 4 protein n=1 Tax=Enterococcus innesii TaxID=2839759 RepID=UPI003D152034
MNRKVLVVASMGSMIAQFNLSNLKLLQKIGYEVHVACNLTSIDPMSEEKRKSLISFFEENNILYYSIDFQRGVGGLKENIKVFKQLKKIFKGNRYEFIHTHSPLASVFSRLFAFRYSIPVIYTAHGFQFFKKGPLKDWLIYFPVEYVLSFITNVVITINTEDSRIAKKMGFKKVVYIPGVGIDYEKIISIKKDSNIYRKDFGFSEKDLILLSVGELSVRKNHEVIIRALVNTSENIKYIVCGTGELHDYLLSLIENLGLTKRIKLLGYRTDVFDIMNMSDIFVFPSTREGLGLAAIEAMASGLPVVASNVNGINDYLIEGETGFSCNPQDIKSFRKYIQKLAESNKLRENISVTNIKFAQKYDKSIINKTMEKVYIDFCGEIK